MKEILIVRRKMQKDRQIPGSPDEGRGDAELSLHAAAEVLGDLVPLVRQSQVGDHRGDFGLDGGRVFPLDAGVEQEVLVDGEAAENFTTYKC